MLFLPNTVDFHSVINDYEPEYFLSNLKNIIMIGCSLRTFNLAEANSFSHQRQSQNKPIP